MYSISSLTIKPIFHCDGKFSRWGLASVQNPQSVNFELPIPTCWYLKTRKPPTPNLKLVLPNAKLKRKSVKFTGCVGSQTQISRIGHVHFMFFCVDFICVGYPTQTRFQWNMVLWDQPLITGMGYTESRRGGRGGGGQVYPYKSGTGQRKF